jgi:sugar-phosphatase
MPFFNCSAILFDLDGVLVDSTGSVERHWGIWAAEHNLDIHQLLAVAHGRRTTETIRLVAPHLDSEAEVQRIEYREAADVEGVRVMPGARELVRSIPEARWGIVTSGTRHLATARLRLAQISIPAVLVTAESVKEGKPNPAPYLTGARLLGFSPQDCIVIEDAPAGIESARAAGATVIALANTYPAEDLKAANAIVSSLAQLVVHSADGLGLTVTF